MFEMPESLDGLDLDALRALSEQALTEARELASKDDAEITDEDMSRAEELMGHSASLDAEITARETAEAERADRLAALREKTAPADSAEEEVSEEEPADEVEEPTEDADEPAGDEAKTEKEVVVAAASPKPTRTVAIAQRNAPEVEVAEEDSAAKASFVAAANVPGYESGSELTDYTEVAKAFAARGRGIVGKGKEVTHEAKQFALSKNAQQFGVANIRKPENEFTISGGSAEDQMNVIMAAANEKRLPQGGLVAAGGWCAPSETLYDFCSFETVSGLLSIPEVTAARGGINFTKGPDYGSIAASWGFIQTEAEAEAGTVKECYEVECPPFTEVRLDAIGFCVTAGILTNAAYPELIRRVLEIGAVAHAHKVNAETISRISTLIGAATDYVEVGGATADVLDALSLQAEVLRYQYSMAPNATLEVILPVWAKQVVRADLSRRNGVDMLAVSDAQIQSYFSVRNLAVQWVYDYQPLATTGTAWPTTLEAMIYPAGAFVKGTLPVISLDAIYDSVNTSTNTFTAAFFEEGLFVANTCGTGRKVSIDISCLAGVTGAAEITCAPAVP